MILDRILKDRSYTEYLRDPNFNGAFLGGPPRLSAEELQRILNDEELDGKVKELLAEINEDLDARQKPDAEAA